MWQQVYKTCKHCSKALELSTDDYVFWRGHFYHTACMSTLEQAKPLKRPRIPEQIKARVQKLKTDGTPAAQAIIQEEQLLNWLRETYQTVYLPPYIQKRIHSLTCGEYEPFQGSIPAGELLDMWQRKEVELTAAARRQGKSISSGPNRIAYDLAILLAHYEDYCKWKEAAEQDAVGVITRQDAPRAIPPKRKTAAKPEPSTGLDMDEAANEIWGELT